MISDVRTNVKQQETKELVAVSYKFLYLKKYGTLHLKLVSAIFYQIFIFPPNDSPSKTRKNVFYFI